MKKQEKSYYEPEYKLKIKKKRGFWLQSAYNEGYLDALNMISRDIEKKATKMWISFSEDITDEERKKITRD